MTNTPFGDWNSETRTLTIGPAQFQWYREAAIRDDGEYEKQLHRLREVFGPTEIALVVDPMLI